MAATAAESATAATVETTTVASGYGVAITAVAAARPALF
jgi:hypothetical protein